MLLLEGVEYPSCTYRLVTKTCRSIIDMCMYIVARPDFDFACAFALRSLESEDGKTKACHSTK